MRKSLLLLLYLLVVPLTAFAQGPLDGTWGGIWLSPSGYVYLAEMRLKVDNSGSLEGEIKWILKESPRAEEQSKLGMTGTEFVRGSFDAKNRLVSFDGYRKDDPNQILGLDKYRLILAENGIVLGGITWNHGAWTGLFSLSRK